MQRVITYLVQKSTFWSFIMLFTPLSILLSVLFLFLYHYSTHDAEQPYILISGLLTATGVALFLAIVGASLMRYCTTSQHRTAPSHTNDAHERLQDIQHIAQFGFWEYFPQDNHLYWSDEVYRIFGIQSKHHRSRFEDFLSFVHPEDRTPLVHEYQRSIQEHRPYHMIHRIHQEDGTLRYIEGRCQHTFNRQGEIVKSLGSVYDVTDKVADRHKLQRLFDLQKNIIIQSNGTRITTVNRSFLDFFELDFLEEFTQDFDCICDHFIPDDRFFHMGKVTEDCHWTACMERLPEKERIVSIPDAKGQVHVFSLTINHFDHSDSVITLTDISETMLQQSHLEHKINCDALTGAFNRNFFNSHINAMMEQTQKDQRHLGIILFDIDHFKHINDTYGHDTGDRVLKSLVTMLKHSIRANDRLIRWGGEEFLLIVEAECIQTLQMIAETIRQRIESESFVENHHISCSFGVTLHDWDDTIEYSIKQADVALYEAKNNGRNLVVAK